MDFTGVTSVDGSKRIVALDVHCGFVELAALGPAGRWLHQERCETSIPAVLAQVERVSRPRVIVFEEGPLADWLLRGLTEKGEEVIVVRSAAQRAGCEGLGQGRCD